MKHNEGIPLRLATLPIPLKILFSCYLLTIGVGYILAIFYLFLVDIEPHTRHGLGMIQAVIVKYYGTRGTTKLEAAVQGSMGESLTASERKQVVEWVRRGAREEEFSQIQSILEAKCGTCHGPQGIPGLPILTTYEGVQPYTQMDTGLSIKTLARVSHVHLFGISFVFLLTGWIFSLSDLSPYWRAGIVALPFVAMWLDIGSWWFTKLQPLFAYVVIVGGVLMGISLALQIGISLYQMWWRGPGKPE